MHASENSISLTPAQKQLRHQLAQKLFIDLRYYCEPPANGYCQEGLSYLPKKLESMLADTQVGGVILFSENLHNTAQIIALNQAMQRAVLDAEPATNFRPQALYIGIDQEGGRVSRLPQEEYLGFAGNMAIGASAISSTQSVGNKNKVPLDIESINVEFAKKVGSATALQLNYLGFNVNFAPVLDVNSQPENPIINVRSYSEFPKLVGKLGTATIDALQMEGIAAAAKHFPGHGDTHIDSHVGLPVVEHSTDDIYRYDLAPFIYAINSQNAAPDMIMTAHIQYPALDNTEFVSKQGKRTILPATLSRKILTGLLRDKLKFKGLIVTDSLEMAAISQFLSPQEAVIKAFKAGADISLMPVTISSAKEADDFVAWLDALTLAVFKDKALVEQVEASFARVIAHKSKRQLHSRALIFIKDSYPEAAFNPEDHRELANEVSRASFTQIKGDAPFTQDSSQIVLAVMPDKLRCFAFLHYAERAKLGDTSCVSALSEKIPSNVSADVFIYGEVSPALGFYESKKWEGINASQRQSFEEQNQAVQLLIEALPSSTKKVLLKLRAPYVNNKELTSFDAIYASYDYQVAVLKKAEFAKVASEVPAHSGIIKPDKLSVEGLNADAYVPFSPAFETFVDTLIGQHKAIGVLPVSH